MNVRSICWRIKIFAFGFLYLVQAWFIKISNQMSSVLFPEIKSHKILTDKEIGSILKCADFFTKFFTLHTGRKCFFRSYIMGNLLRKEGIPAVMNIGLFTHQQTRKRRGHCWLTLNDEPFKEKRDPFIMFPVDLGAGYNGIRYWTDGINPKIEK
ncbi:hypothetical protein MTBBW1_60016 [Desulfamplus magnetovallimortis]|uniref:Microcin J25-processing protein McjB C-terminal domain-containing protein n=1 Tax=Desulfamplus magnetovallimortis TaxID=1246637 RepID=A0A1W1HI39_9BACT|nr:lasso peptide biosynthesis protein [Desulfamplus magnetovallimortis]SLM32116.1 hypothetical protein MTBBW1_60016 [Desulfamplus magnetovallimortis]